MFSAVSGLGLASRDTACQILLFARDGCPQTREAQYDQTLAIYWD